MRGHCPFNPVKAWRDGFAVITWRRRNSFDHTSVGVERLLRFAWVCLFCIVLCCLPCSFFLSCFLNHFDAGDSDVCERLQISGTKFLKRYPSLNCSCETIFNSQLQRFSTSVINVLCFWCSIDIMVLTGILALKQYVSTTFRKRVSFCHQQHFQYNFSSNQVSL